MVAITKPNTEISGTTVIGLSFREMIGGDIVDTGNRLSVLGSNITTAIVVSVDSLHKARSFNMLIINDPTPFEKVDSTSNRTIASSIAIATINRINASDNAADVALYFQVVKAPTSSIAVTYVCAFYDSKSSQWNESGCTPPVYNARLDRYECNCKHLTSFALVWLPQVGSSGSIQQAVLDNQDKASIAFQIISICCFIGVVVHAITTKFANPDLYITLRLFLPVISCAVTMILFIFWIAMGLTVYSRFSPSSSPTGNPPDQQKGRQENFLGMNSLESKLDSRAGSSIGNTAISNVPCLSNEYALMFISYFLIMFMFAVKTSIGYYNYLNYFKCYPPPPLWSLAITLSISFLTGILLMSIAAGLNSNPSNRIAEVYLGKICWFNRNSIHYFLTIPICLCLVINIFVVVRIMQRRIKILLEARSDKEALERLHRSSIIILTSCCVQGLGWLFGPMIFIASQAAAEGLGWLFIIFNALEGIWVVILYVLARKSHMDEKIRKDNYEQGNDGQTIIGNDNDSDVNPPKALQPPSPINQNVTRRPVPGNLRPASPRNSFADLGAIELQNRGPTDNDSDR